MIGVVTSPTWTASSLHSFLNEHAPELTQDYKAIDWADVLRRSLRRSGLPDAHTWIFVAHDAYAHRQLYEVECILVAEGRRVLNRPSKTLRRFDLQKELRLKGINSFDVHNTEDGAQTWWRYPVFIRAREAHNGSLTSLLCDYAEARETLDEHPHLRSPETMAVEFVDTSRDGLYRKYSFMRVGDRYVARHVLFGNKWVLKEPDHIDSELATEELRFCVNGEPPPAIVQAFNLAGIEYGRIDYSLNRDMQPQVWEINQNPTVFRMRDIHPLRQRAQAHSAQEIARALKDLR